MAVCLGSPGSPHPRVRLSMPQANVACLSGRSSTQVPLKRRQATMAASDGLSVWATPIRGHPTNASRVHFLKTTGQRLILWRSPHHDESKVRLGAQRKQAFESGVGHVRFQVPNDVDRAGS
jgi:hypothetical protein